MSIDRSSYIYKGKSSVSLLLDICEHQNHGQTASFRIIQQLGFGCVEAPRRKWSQRDDSWPLGKMKKLWVTTWKTIFTGLV